MAQKRYREGQKRKMADTEEQVAELTAKLNALATEKVPAWERSAVLSPSLCPRFVSAPCCGMNQH